MKEIIVTIDEKGNAKIETRGFAGKGCQDATAALEDALGIKTSDVQTAEFHTTETETVAVKARI